MMIPLSEYARRNGRKPDSAKHLAARGRFSTVQKVGLIWMVEESEPWPKRPTKYKKSAKQSMMNEKGSEA